MIQFIIYNDGVTNFRIENGLKTDWNWIENFIL